MNDVAARAKDIAEKYYDSSDADGFYSSIWGGEDIHIGVYRSADEAIADASRRTVAEMAARVPDIGSETTIVDIGAGYGGAARYLARTYGCRVLCVNLSEAQNARNRLLNERQGLADRIDVLHGTFEQLPIADHTCDVVWSQDAILHSGDRKRVLAEVRRVLRPAGHFIFTDPMQSDDCPPSVLDPVCARLQLSSLGSFSFYRAALGELGFREVAIEDLTAHLVRHYTRVGEELESRRDQVLQSASVEYVGNMRRGLNHWIDAGRNGHLAWGILHFRC